MNKLSGKYCLFDNTFSLREKVEKVSENIMKQMFVWKRSSIAWHTFQTHWIINKASRDTSKHFLLNWEKVEKVTENSWERGHDSRLRQIQRYLTCQNRFINKVSTSGRKRKRKRIRWNKYQTWQYLYLRNGSSYIVEIWHVHWVYQSDWESKIRIEINYSVQ